MVALELLRMDEGPAGPIMVPVGYVGPDGTRCDRPHLFAPAAADAILDRARNDAPSAIVSARQWKSLPGAGL